MSSSDYTNSERKADLAARNAQRQKDRQFEVDILQEHPSNPTEKDYLRKIATNIEIVNENLRELNGNIKQVVELLSTIASMLNQKKTE